MVPTRASEEHELTPVTQPRQSIVMQPAPAAESGSQAIIFTRALRQDARWLGGVSLLYIVLVIATVLTLHAYFAQTWDAVTFVGAGKIIWSADWMGLYAQSRADNYWPYAYPPLHAFVVAPFVAIAGIAPEWLMVRVPSLLFDIALGVLLYCIVLQKTRNPQPARLACAVWLLNPVTWYDTAVQGHFESEWLFFVALAYFVHETRAHWFWASVSLAVAFLFKQNAILFALPFWAILFFQREKIWTQRVVSVLKALVVFAIPVFIVSLPFLLYSNDFAYMNVQYVSAVPLQTQSWLVAVAGIFSQDNLLLRASSVLLLIAAGLISVLGARRGMGLWLMGLLIVLSFFLLSKKVVGYYYVMILPFAAATLIPTQNFRWLAVIVAALGFIFVSPYFASWAKQTHWWVYALLGIANSALWLGLWIWLWRKYPNLNARNLQSARTPGFLAVALFLCACAAALVQPLITSQASPIRAPLVASGNELQVLFALGAFALLCLVAIIAAQFFSRTIARKPHIPAGAYAVVVSSALLYFLTFAMTKESTAAVEVILKALGI